MTHPRTGLASVLALVCALTCALPAAARAGEIVVARDAGLSAAERADLRADAGVTHKRMLRLPRSEVVTVPDGREAAALAALNRDPDVRYAEPVVRFTLASFTDDPYFDDLWALENTGQPLPPRGATGTPDADMDVPEAWGVSRGAGQTVAVVDSGIQETQPDLAANIAPGARSFLADVPATGDVYGHGTRVAGVIAAVADNGIGIAGVAPEAKVLSLKAFEGENANSDAIADALEYAGRLDGVRVVNLSFSGSADAQVVHDAIARHPGTLYVVAAGNGGDDRVGDNLDAPAGGESGPQYPCSYDLPNVICVGGTDANDEVTSWSNYGAVSVDLFAPGEAIFTTRPSGFGASSGTSMAAPMVAAEAALLLSVRPNLSAASLRRLLLDSVDPIPDAADRSATGGRANAGELLAAPVVDGDADGVLDEIDSCPTDFNPEQADADGDGTGDACDPSPRGDDVDGDTKAYLDDRCPALYGAEPDGCPATVVTPPGRFTPAGPPAPGPTPTASVRVASLSVRVTPKRCPRARSGCRKAAKVTVTLTHSATASLRFEQRVKRGRRLVWRTYTTRSLKAMTSARSLTLKRLKPGSYRVTVIVAGGRKTKHFRV